MCYHGDPRKAIMDADGAKADVDTSGVTNEDLIERLRANPAVLAPEPFVDWAAFGSTMNVVINLQSEEQEAMARTIAYERQLASAGPEDEPEQEEIEAEEPPVDAWAREILVAA